MAHSPVSHPHPTAKPKKSLAWSQAVFMTAAIVLIVGIVWLTMPRQAKAPAIENQRDVSMTTDNGITLAAHISLPPGSAKVPAVILVHEFSKDRHQWDPYLQDFLQAGFAVLAYDVRGFGSSKLPTIPTDFKAWYNDMPKDVPAVITYLQHQSRVNSQQINIVGAVLGANIAYVASGSHLGLNRVVLLSPDIKNGVLDGKDVSNFSPTGILGVADVSSVSNLDGLVAFTHDPKSVYRTETPGTGVDLLKQTAVLGSVLSWLKQ